MIDIDDFECPHCNAVNDTTDWFDHWHWDGDVFEIRCCKCEKSSYIKVTVSVDYERVEDESNG